MLQRRMAASEQRVDRYELVGELASGGMATVYLGRQHGPFGFKRTVAIKSMHPQFARDEGFRAMFLDEASLTARIRHPNVVPTLDIVSAETNLLIVMEYVEGVALSTLLQRVFEGGLAGRLTPAIASAIMCDVLHGLHAAHELRDDHDAPLDAVHRDVSPQNVHVGSDGLGRVLDFGVAKAASRRYVTQSGEVKGKLAYMSIEQVCGEAVDRRTDVYAAGVVLWEMLTGRRLVNGPNEGAILKQVMEGVFDPPSFSADEQLSPALDKVVMKALSLDKEDRWPSADAMAIALTEAVPPAPRPLVMALVRDAAGPELESRRSMLRTNREASTGAPAKEFAALAEVLTEHATETSPQALRSAETVADRAPLPSSLEPSSAAASGRSSVPLAPPSRRRLVVLVAGAATVLALAASAFAVGRRVGPSGSGSSELAAVPSTSVPTAAAPATSVSTPPPPAVASAAPVESAPVGSSAPQASTKPGLKPKSPKRPDCRVPYVVDANGDRHYRPECVKD